LDRNQLQSPFTDVLTGLQRVLADAQDAEGVRGWQRLESIGDVAKTGDDWRLYPGESNTPLKTWDKIFNNRLSLRWRLAVDILL